MESSWPSLVAIVAERLNVPPGRLTPQTRLQHDLGVDGDDGFELLEALAERFGIEVAHIAELAPAFGPEAGPNPLSLLWAWWRPLPSLTMADLQRWIERHRRS